MRHVVTPGPESVAVAFEGEIDLQTSPQVRALLLDCVERNGVVVVDLAGVTYIDSSGIASLVEAYQLAKQRSSVLALAAVGPAALRVLQLARLDRVFPIHERVEDALRGSDPS